MLRWLLGPSPGEMVTACMAETNRRQARRDLISITARAGRIAGLREAADLCTSGKEGLRIEEEILERIAALQDSLNG